MTTIATRRQGVRIAAVLLTMAGWALPLSPLWATPVQLALWNPVQVFPDTDDVEGFRLNLIYGKNRDVSGLDVGLVNRATGNVNGLQWAVLWNEAGSRAPGSTARMEGIQLAWLVNRANSISGLQIGHHNDAMEMRGLQIGTIWNSARDASGLQLALLVNYARTLSGVQIGLINIIHDGPLVVFPIVNACF